jgi:predicted NAD/FAD-binding protein
MLLIEHFSSSNGIKAQKTRYGFPIDHRNHKKRFDILSFLQFFHNHGLLSVKNRPQWKTVVGGSNDYIKRMEKAWKQVDVRLSAGLAGIKRDAEGVEITFANGGHERFDHVVIATHADQALRLLRDPREEETKALGCWKYSRSRTLLHTDESALPPLRKVWSSWNFTRRDGNQTCLTYDMNRLQGLKTRNRYLVSLNLPKDPSGIVSEFMYEHPMYTSEALSLRPQLKKLNGKNNTWFAGSYFGNGFHEDAVESGIAVAEAFGIEL